jgi:class 3 adenylate cyclase
MMTLSFRIKLLLAMMLLVGCVTAATLYVTQNKVETTYLRLYQDQFESEVDYFAVQQESRLRPVKETCITLARSTELQEALLKPEARKVYNVVSNVMSLSPAKFPRPALRNGSGPVPGTLTFIPRNWFFRVLDSNGNILRLSEQRGAMNLTSSRKRLEKQLLAVQNSMDVLVVQQVGFLAQEGDNGKKAQLLEVIVTKITDSETGRTLGAIVLGMPFLETDEITMKKMSGIESGIWLDNHIHSETIEENLHEEVAAMVAEQVSGTNQNREAFTIKIAGIPRRTFFKILNPNSPFPPAYQVSLYSLASAIKTQEELRGEILGFSAAAVFGALLLSLVISHNFSVPLRDLVKATEAVRNGNFEVKVPVRSRDEVGELAASFNEMAEGLAQKEKYRTILNMVTDDQVAQELMKGNALDGELRETTVLFCDIRGFTPLTENMPPEEVIEMLNEHMTALTRIVKEHEGVLDKFVGDLLMAIFGAPVSHQNDSLNAARCALRFIQQREALNATSRHQLKIGIGIATGKVVAGCMGSYNSTRTYTVLGERVNLASRLCSQAGPGQVIIDQATKEKLGNAISTRPLPALNLKGFREDIRAFELTEVHSWELLPGADAGGV